MESEVLLLEATDIVHVKRVKAALSFLLVSRQLLLLHGLQTNSSVIANADDEDAAALSATLVVVLIREGDVDLGDVVGGVRGGVGIGEHGRTIAGDVDGAGAAVMGGLNGEAGRLVATHVVSGLAVCGKAFFTVYPIVCSASTDEEETGHKDENEENKAEDHEQNVDHF